MALDLANWAEIVTPMLMTGSPQPLANYFPISADYEMLVFDYFFLISLLLFVCFFLIFVFVTDEGNLCIPAWRMACQPPSLIWAHRGPAACRVNKFSISHSFLLLLLLLIFILSFDYYCRLKCHRAAIIVTLIRAIRPDASSASWPARHP